LCQPGQIDVQTRQEPAARALLGASALGDLGAGLRPDRNGNTHQLPVASCATLSVRIIDVAFFDRTGRYDRR
jgi:hypothetical protein